MAKFRLGQEADLPQVVKLLTAADLPTEDVSLSKITFFIATLKEEVVGCIGLEAAGKEGLLRSMAVTQAMRSQGIGHQLYHQLVGYCTQNGISSIHLLTVDADKYFESKGFVHAARNNAPKSIQQTVEFATLCPSSCSYMVKQHMDFINPS